MGTLMMGLSTDTPRGVLGVPGAAYPFLLGTSTDASLVLALIGTGFNRLDQLVWFLETGEVVDVCGGEGCSFDGEP